MNLLSLWLDPIGNRLEFTVSVADILSAQPLISESILYAFDLGETDGIAV